ncbi:MAG: UDP-N-acetylmuramoyl-L-alanyl-D-glutamate--2,6-diaminopimelate ligase [Verrucomicrobiaceae bacterium]|nr:UDP-N-acetylmuramoyl-L-alanyl-D-glutamate--2,6-diaminopimelate ligase [Verrucomicrobiaceae bacterium]
MNKLEEKIVPTTLFELSKGLLEIPYCDYMDSKITGIQLDSRLVNTGDLFIACFGRSHDARNFIDQAIRKGCGAVLAEFTSGMNRLEVRANVPIIGVENLSKKVSEIASRFYHHPSSQLKVIGITGTNGKTSCSKFIATALQKLGYRCGMMGTLGCGVPDALEKTLLTTPDAVLAQRQLAQMVSKNCEHVAMEVSSVGLDQKRVEAIRFDTAVFTNLTRDHLDYHKTMSEYAESKRKLFQWPGLKSAVLNLDDEFSLSLINSIRKEVEIFTYSVSNRNASVYSESLTFSKSWYSALVNTPFGCKKLSGELLGRFNFSNVLAVIATIISLMARENSGRIDLAKIIDSISSLSSADGRMEIVNSPNEITTIVDYAHTPDSLKNALETLKCHSKGEIWCVFGCGGNRDEGKRPIMGEIAELFADHIVITDDNPRNEPGDRIVSQILSGIQTHHNVSIIRNRAKAISHVIASASPADLILIAGKGHETYQEISGRRVIFSDKAHAKSALKARGSVT